jgi:hypothetical protein
MVRDVRDKGNPFVYDIGIGGEAAAVKFGGPDMLRFH